VTLIPYVGPWGEVKTKPTQHSVIKLREIGIQPDILICRTKLPLDEEMKEKISLFCDVDKEAVIEARDTETIYEVPLRFEEEGLARRVVTQLGLGDGPANLDAWADIVRRIKQPRFPGLKVAIVGKYVANGDAYISIAESIKHAGVTHDAGIEQVWIDSEELDEASSEEVAARLAEDEDRASAWALGEAARRSSAARARDRAGRCLLVIQSG